MTEIEKSLEYPTYETEVPWGEQKERWLLKNPNKKGMKFSEGKPKWQYMKPLWKAMEEVVRVLTRGAEKYEPDNWMSVEREEYERAIMSHYTAYMSGEVKDPDTHTHHLANLICSALFLIHRDGIK